MSFICSQPLPELIGLKDVYKPIPNPHRPSLKSPYIGRGGYGMVYSAISSANKIYAIKTIRLEKARDERGL